MIQISISLQCKDLRGHSGHTVLLCLMQSAQVILEADASVASHMSDVIIFGAQQLSDLQPNCGS